MCSTCGCNQPADAVTIVQIGADVKLPARIQAHAHHHHHHGHDHHHHHDHQPGQRTVVDLEQDILQKNNLLAQRNRGYFEARNVLALNLVSSPGSGKTTLLEMTLRDLKDEIPFFVVEGDQQTFHDANRIAATGVPVVQVNTGKGCHLDADMVHSAVKKMQPADNAILMIENVGNLVCPALFDLGESGRVVIISVTEGDDKPVKYPDMFHSADLCIINKIDLLPYVQFDVQQARNYALQVNHHLDFIELSATTGQGKEAWYEWLRQKRNAVAEH